MHALSPLRLEVEAVGLDESHVALDHVLDELRERDRVLPAELGARLGWVAHELLDFGRAVVLGIDAGRVRRNMSNGVHND